MGRTGIAVLLAGVAVAGCGGGHSHAATPAATGVAAASGAQVLPGGGGPSLRPVINGPASTGQAVAGQGGAGSVGGGGTTTAGAGTGGSVVRLVWPVRKGRRKSSGSRLGRYYLQRSTQGNARPRDSRTNRCTHRSLWSARPARRCQRLRPVRIVREGRRTPPRALRALRSRRNPVTAIGSRRTPPTTAAAATIRSPSTGERRRQGSSAVGSTGLVDSWRSRDRLVSTTLNGDGRPGLAAVRRPPQLARCRVLHAGNEEADLGRREPDETNAGRRDRARKPMASASFRSRVIMSSSRSSKTTA